MKPVRPIKLVKSVIALAVVNACLSQSVFAEEAKGDDSDRIEKIIVTANRHAQDLQEVSSSITALGADDVERAGIIDITGLQQVVPGLKDFVRVVLTCEASYFEPKQCKVKIVFC